MIPTINIFFIAGLLCVNETVCRCGVHLLRSFHHVLRRQSRFIWQQLRFFRSFLDTRRSTHGGSDSRGSWNFEPFRHAARSIVALRWTRPANGETKAISVGASVLRPSVWTRSPPCTPPSPTGFGEVESRKTPGKQRFSHLLPQLCASLRRCKSCQRFS